MVFPYQQTSLKIARQPDPRSSSLSTRQHAQENQCSGCSTWQENLQPTLWTKFFANGWLASSSKSVLCQMLKASQENQFPKLLVGLKLNFLFLIYSQSAFFFGATHESDQRDLLFEFLLHGSQDIVNH